MCEPVARITQKSAEDGIYVLENNTDRPFAQGYFLAWFLEYEGFVIDKGEIICDASPHGSTEFCWSHDLPQNGVSAVLFSVVSREDGDYSPRDREYAYAQFILCDPEKNISLPACDQPMKCEETPSLVAMHAPSFAVALSKETMLPLQWVFSGMPLLDRPATLTAGEMAIRAFRPAVNAGKARGDAHALFACLDSAEHPFAAGEIRWSINGNGAALLSVVPDVCEQQCILRLAVSSALDYVEYFGMTPSPTPDGAQSDPVLKLEEGPRSKEDIKVIACRSASFSSGDVTLHLIPSRPLDMSIGDDLTIDIPCGCEILISAEYEGENA